MLDPEAGAQALTTGGMKGGGVRGAIDVGRKRWTDPRQGISPVCVPVDVAPASIDAPTS